MSVLYKQLICLVNSFGERITNMPVSGVVRAKVLMLEDHQERGGKAGKHTITSEVKSIDFMHRLIVTRTTSTSFRDGGHNT